MMAARNRQLLQTISVLICVVLPTVFSEGVLMVRLVGGPNNSSGRLEVKTDGAWGTVCDDSFDHKAATVVCKAFGYNHGMVVDSHFGKGKDPAPIWLDDVSCTGNESSLLDCSHRGWGIHDCSHIHDVELICIQVQGDVVVRLVGGPSNYSGRLEVKTGDGPWGTVCDDGFDENAAMVTCKGLGVNRGQVAGQRFGVGNERLPIWLNLLRCYGNESSLFECSHRGWGSHICDHKEDVSVTCDCPAGTYGPNCDGRCGECGFGSCSRVDGTCPGSCRQWWVTAHCNVHIRDVEFSADSQVAISNVTDHSVIVHWTAVDGILASLTDHYFYVVQYKPDSTEQPWENVITVPHHDMSTYETKVKYLTYNTAYDFRVVPWRTHKGFSSQGQAAAPVVIHTKCITPGNVTLAKIVTYYESNNRPVEMMLIIWQDPEVTGCGSLSRTVLGYRKPNSDSWIEQIEVKGHQHTFHPLHTGQYIVAITIYNDAGLYSVKEEHVSVKGRRIGSGNTAMAIPLGVGVPAGLILLTIAIILLFRRRRGRLFRSDDGTASAREEPTATQNNEDLPRAPDSGIYQEIDLKDMDPDPNTDVNPYVKITSEYLTLLDCDAVAETPIVGTTPECPIISIDVDDL